MNTMTISTGEGSDAVSVTVQIHEPSRFDDPQWAKWNMDEADVCAAACKQVRVSKANGTLRKELRKAVRRGVKGAALTELLQKLNDEWTAGRRSGGQVIDVRALKLSAKQIEGLQADNPTATILS